MKQQMRALSMNLRSLLDRKVSRSLCMPFFAPAACHTAASVATALHKTTRQS